MRPIIGIVARVVTPDGDKELAVHDKFRRAIIKSGGNPICILPPQDIDYISTKYNDQKELTEEEKEMLISQIEMCDGILMPGGYKINKYDRFISEYATDKDIPLLGICLGMQIMSNYKKEQLWNEKNDSFIEHQVMEGFVHEVTLDKSSILYSIVGNERFMVTSRHSFHALPNDYYDVTSVSDDNYIESIEMKNKKFNLGVQWHPEGLNDDPSKKIFKYFIDICK